MIPHRSLAGKLATFSLEIRNLIRNRPGECLARVAGKIFTKRASGLRGISMEHDRLIELAASRANPRRRAGRPVNAERPRAPSAEAIGRGLRRATTRTGCGVWRACRVCIRNRRGDDCRRHRTGYAHRPVPRRRTNRCRRHGRGVRGAAVRGRPMCRRFSHWSRSAPRSASISP